MTCREFTEFLDDYLAGRLLPEEAAAFHAHIGVCADCVAYLDSYRTTVDLCRSLRGRAEPLPAEIPEELVRAILASRPKA